MDKNLILIIDDQVWDEDDPLLIGLRRAGFYIRTISFPDSKKIPIDELLKFSVFISDVRDERGKDNFFFLELIRKEGLKTPFVFRTNYSIIDLNNKMVTGFIEKKGSGLFYLSKEESLNKTIEKIENVLKESLDDESIILQINSVLSKLPSKLLDIKSTVLKILNLCDCHSQDNLLKAEKYLDKLKKDIDKDSIHYYEESLYSKVYSESLEAFKNLKEYPDFFVPGNSSKLTSGKHPYLFYLERLRDKLLFLAKMG